MQRGEKYVFFTKKTTRKGLSSSVDYAPLQNNNTVVFKATMSPLLFFASFSFVTFCLVAWWVWNRKHSPPSAGKKSKRMHAGLIANRLCACDRQTNSYLR